MRNRRFAVLVQTYSLEENRVGHDQQTIFEYRTDRPKAAARILAEMINGKSKRAKMIKGGMRFTIFDRHNSLSYSLNAFRHRSEFDKEE